jgi:hypothetical protein
MPEEQKSSILARANMSNLTALSRLILSIAALVVSIYNLKKGTEK